MKIIDAHSHIDYITHNFQKDVVGTICCAKNETEWMDLLTLAGQDKKVYAAFGIHPWFIDTFQNGFENRLLDILKTNRSFMVGEIGLDKNYPNMEKQIDIFIKQLEMAIELNRPVFLHCVGAWDKVLHIFKQYKKLPKIVAHSFNGSDSIIKELCKNYDVVFSFGKNALYDKNSRIEQIDSDKILVETDAKESVCLLDIVNKISSIKNDLDFWEIIYQNTQRIINNE